MDLMSTKIDIAIARSISHTEIVTVTDITPAQVAYLREQADDHAETIYSAAEREHHPCGGLIEAWGTDSEGQEWRVHGRLA